MNIGNRNIKIATLAGAAAAAGSLLAGVPLNNLQGTGGIAFNPLAYTAGRPWSGDDGGGTTNIVEASALDGIVSRPQLGAWYVNLTDAEINWFSLGAAVTFFDRLEVSGGYESINAKNYGDNNINKYGAAVFANIDLIPVEQVAIGFEYKQGVHVGDGITNHDYFDGHVAWFVTDKLTLVGAYAYTGDKDRFYRDGRTDRLGVGGGFVLSLQYQF